MQERRPRWKCATRVRLVAAFACVWSAACGSVSEPGLTAPSQVTRLEGTVVRHRDGAPVVGARVAVEPGDGIAVTDSLGRFEIAAADLGVTVRLVASAPGFLDRAVVLAAEAGEQLQFDMIQDAVPFSLEFYRRFARGVRPGESLTGMTLRPWTRQPSFYVRTVADDSGEAIPSEVLNGIERVFRATVPALSGGHARVEGFELGAEARPEQPGWVNVTFSNTPPLPRDPDDPVDGVATVGGNQGWIWIRYPAREVAASAESQVCGHRILDVADHEIVHTMGFRHTANEFDFRSEFCDGSSRTVPALYHSEIVYSRPPFNLDPDFDVVRYEPLLGTLTAAEPADQPLVVACTVR